MRRRTLRLLTAIAACIGSSALFASEELNLKAIDLRCESEASPLGIDTTQPHLSWRLEAPGRKPGVSGQEQIAYRVLVASSQDKLARDIGDLWDSGKVDSDQSQHVEYAGSPLRSKMECHWKVRVWPDDGEPSDWSSPAKWTMGLLEPGDPSTSKDSAAAGWEAQWIGPPPPSINHGELTIKKAIHRVGARWPTGTCTSRACLARRSTSHEYRHRYRLVLDRLAECLSVDPPSEGDREPGVSQRVISVPQLRCWQGG